MLRPGAAPGAEEDQAQGLRHRHAPGPGRRQAGRPGRIAPMQIAPVQIAPAPIHIPAPATAPAPAAPAPAALRGAGGRRGAQPVQEVIAISRVIDELRQASSCVTAATCSWSTMSSLVLVHLTGACAGCQLAGQTLGGIQQRISGNPRPPGPGDARREA